jgi:hypothetical protein
VPKFIDCHVHLERPDPIHPPEGCLGVVLFGPGAKGQRQQLESSGDGVLWRHAESLERIVGEAHACFPSRTAAMIDLHLGSRLLEGLEKPAEWWPLCYPLRCTSRLIRLNLPPGAKIVAKVKQVLRRHPETFFLFEPFVHGPVEGWQAHVRMAERANVWISTLGFSSHLHAGWGEREIREALHFVVGEVGAARLLYASGMDWFRFANGEDAEFREWLGEQSIFAPREADLVLFENAWRLLHVEERL